ncbi:MAG: ATPase [Chitinivibrionales bacterium]|nr:ATPase [Chitinivibrionales bacterium]MBD3395839.1 ATPase [Chitinivibrionales bacterium]
MDWGHILSMIGMGCMVGLSGAGSAIGTSIGGMAVVGMMKKKPEAFGSGMVLAAMPATQGLYGFVGFIIYNGLLAGIGTSLSLWQGSVVLGAGIAIGLACLISAIKQGEVVANGIAAIGSGHNVFGNTLILGAFPEFYAILSLVAAILMQGLLKV